MRLLNQTIYAMVLQNEGNGQASFGLCVNGEIKLIPEKFINTYRHWMENVRDWNISRQLWWGQQIPAWYLPNGEYVVAKNIEEALEEAKQKGNTQLQLMT
jgi:valyl-tRNA synthetase